MIKKINKIKLITLLISIFFFLNSCENRFFRKVDTRQVSTNADERARQAVKEGRGIGIKNVFGKGKTNYEFSTSNPLWRASLEVLDFLPLSNVDYSGGVIISDWYTTNNNENNSIKISLRFLSNEIRSDSIKVTVFKKNCLPNTSCAVTKSNSKIQEELVKSILTKAGQIQEQDKKK